MEQIKTLEGIHGKMVGKTVLHDGTVFLIFSDGTFMRMRAETEEYSSDLHIEIHDDPMNNEEKVAVGLMTQEEVNALRLKHREQQDEARQRHDLRVLAELKAKYEPEAK